MKAIIREKSGAAFSTMRLKEIEAPILKEDEIKVQVVSSRINPVDMDLMKGFPSLKYKEVQVGGVDGAGTITQVGAAVSNFKVGDAVFFYRLFSDIGTWAEEITIPASHAALLPDKLSTQDAGAIALPLLTAFEGLKQLNVQSGETILIHGAGGGVGFQVVQLAKSLGLKVIAHASERDRHDLEKVGIDRFIDYKTSDFVELLRHQPPNYVFDVVGKTTLRKSIELGPKAIVSTTYPDVSIMHKTGVRLPGFLQLIMRWMNRPFNRLAKKYQVRLIGQVTGANGKLLHQAAEIIDQMEIYHVRSYKTLVLDTIALKGLEPSNIGQVILFDQVDEKKRS